MAVETAPYVAILKLINDDEVVIDSYARVTTEAHLNRKGAWSARDRITAATLVQAPFTSRPSVDVHSLHLVIEEPIVGQYEGLAKVLECISDTDIAAATRNRAGDYEVVPQGSFWTYDKVDNNVLQELPQATASTSALEQPAALQAATAAVNTGAGTFERTLPTHEETLQALKHSEFAARAPLRKDWLSEVRRTSKCGY